MKMFNLLILFEIVFSYEVFYLVGVWLRELISECRLVYFIVFVDLCI